MINCFCLLSFEQDSYTSLISSCLLCNQDAIVIVYSITDKRSFVKACDLVKLIQSDLGSLHNQSNSISIIQKFKPIIALIGNKNDLTHFRSVKLCINKVSIQLVSLSYIVNNKLISTHS